MKNEILENMITRRSCRAYKPDQITVEELETVLEAGAWASSGKGLQSPILIAVQDKETRDLLSQLNAKYLGKEGFDPFYGAPTVVAVLVPEEIPTGINDGSLCIGNMLNAAHSIGLGACWIHRAKEVFSDEEGRELLARWGISENYVGVGHCVLGYPAGEPAPAPERKAGRVYEIL